MKSLLLILLLSISTLYAFPSQIVTEKNIFQYGIPIQKSNDVSIEKEKTYCSPFAKTKYKLLITKDKIRITRLYKEYKDVFT